MTRLRASVVQICTGKGNVSELLDKINGYVEKAHNADSEMCVFPEALIGGYPKGSNFGVIVGARPDQGREEYLQYYKKAVVVDPPGPEIKRLEEISGKHRVNIVIGVIEKDTAGGTLYCTAVFIDRNKGCIGKHRKLMPTAAERLIWGQGDASTLPVVELDFDSCPVRTSATICWENYMPLLRTFYYSKRTQLYCAPTVDSRPEWLSTMQHIALEGRQFVLSVCQFAKQKHYPDDHPLLPGEAKDPEGIVIAGGSVIINPLGKILAGPLRGDEGILTADIDLEDITKGHFDMDAVGHYSRPDIFQLKVHGLKNNS